MQLQRNATHAFFFSFFSEWRRGRLECRVDARGPSFPDHSHCLSLCSEGKAMAMLCRGTLAPSRRLPTLQHVRCFSTRSPAYLSCSLPAARSTSVGSSALDEAEQELAQRVTEAKAAMVQLGYHGPSLWTQVICWGDHDQVSPDRQQQSSKLFSP